jgi:DNA-binding NtrC family response regulator
MACVLIVEDDEQLRVLAESVIKDAGNDVLSAAAVESAKALIDSDQTIDILFVDIQLGSDLEAGLTLAKYAQEKCPGLRIIYTTGQGVTEGTRKLFVDGFVFLSKPYTAEHLLVAIGECG